MHVGPRSPRKTTDPRREGAALLVLIGLLVLVAAFFAGRQWLNPAAELEEEPTGQGQGIGLERTVLEGGAGLVEEKRASEMAAAAAAGDQQRLAVLRMNEEAVALLDQGQTEAALERIREARALEPEDDFLARQLSRIAVRRASELTAVGRLEEALALLDEAMAVDADGGLPAAWKGRLLMRQGRRAEAMELVVAQLEAVPESVPLLRLRAELARLEGDDAATVAYLERALAAAPELPGLAEEVTRATEEARAMASYLTDATAHFDLRFDPADAALVQAMPELGALVEEAWSDVLAATGLRPQQRVLVLFLDPARYRMAAPDWSSGLYDGRVRIVIDDPEEHLTELARTLRHELTHAALFTLGAPLPTWLHEGLAQQVEGADVGFARARLVAQGQWFLAPEELSGDWTVWRDQDRVREAYFYSLSLATWLGDEFGGTVWGNLFQNLRGRSFQEAWQLTFGASWDAVEARHRLTLS